MNQEKAASMEKFTEAVMHILTTSWVIALPEARRALLREQVSHIVSRLHSPDHPPYAWMIERALLELNQKQGSTEDSISNFIQNEYHDLPWSHLTMLKYHLARLCQSGELVATSGQRYLLAAQMSDRKIRTKNSKLKRKRGWDHQEIMQRKRHKKANKGNIILNTDNAVVGLMHSQQKDHVTSTVLNQVEECTIKGNIQQNSQNNDVELLCSQVQTSMEHQKEEQVAHGNRRSRVLRAQTCKQNQAEVQKSDYPIHQGILKDDFRKNKSGPVKYSIHFEEEVSTAANSSLTKQKFGRPPKSTTVKFSLMKPKLGRPTKPKGPVRPTMESSSMKPKLGRPPKTKGPVITAVKSSLKKKTTYKRLGRPRLTDR